jgi:glycosyltransferase involved in cell wall biosynthesis
MKICYFGIYDPDYSRNAILISGLVDNGHSVVQCHANPRLYRGIWKYFRLFKEFSKIKHDKFDFVIVGFPGQTVVWLAKVLFKCRVILDSFVSLYDSNVLDRRLYSKFSVYSVRDYILDYYSTHLADKILLDTNEHIQYFVNKFSLPREKFIRVFVGSSDKIFYPRKYNKDKNRFTVHFHGSYIPLQGVENIVQAANLLKNESIHFRFIGGEKMHKYIDEEIKKNKLTNIELVGRVALDKLPDEIVKSDICLGIFGGTDKAQRVIPNKVFEGMAMGMPVVTMKTNAIDELFTDHVDIVLTKDGTPQSIAKAIIELRDSPELMSTLRINSIKIFSERLIPKVLVDNMLKSI